MSKTAPTNKLTKATNIVKKEGDNYKEQLRELEEEASRYYRYIFGLAIGNIKSSDTLYMPSSIDIDTIFKKMPNEFEDDVELVSSLSMLLKTTEDDYLSVCIAELRRLISDEHKYLNLLSQYNHAIIFTMSYNTKIKAIRKRLQFLEHIINNKDTHDFQIMSYFDGGDKPEEQLQELSCIIQNMYNRIFPGFYTYEEICALLKLVTGKVNIAHKDIKNVWECLPQKIKRILPNPYLNVQDLLTGHLGNPPSHSYPFEKTL